MLAPVVVVVVGPFCFFPFNGETDIESKLKMDNLTTCLVQLHNHWLNSGFKILVFCLGLFLFTIPFYNQRDMVLVHTGNYGGMDASQHYFEILKE